MANPPFVTPRDRQPLAALRGFQVPGHNRDKGISAASHNTTTTAGRKLNSSKTEPNPRQTAPKMRQSERLNPPEITNQKEAEEIHQQLRVDYTRSHIDMQKLGQIFHNAEQHHQGRIATLQDSNSQLEKENANLVEINHTQAQRVELSQIVTSIMDKVVNGDPEAIAQMHTIMQRAANRDSHLLPSSQLPYALTAGPSQSHVRTVSPSPEDYQSTTNANGDGDGDGDMEMTDLEDATADVDSDENYDYKEHSEDSDEDMESSEDESLEDDTVNVASTSQPRPMAPVPGPTPAQSTTQQPQTSSTLKSRQHAEIIGGQPLTNGIIGNPLSATSLSHMPKFQVQVLQDGGRTKLHNSSGEFPFGQARRFPFSVLIEVRNQISAWNKGFHAEKEDFPTWMEQASNEDHCVGFLRSSANVNDNRFAKKYGRSVACKKCTNARRPCMIVEDTALILLPIHPVARHIVPDIGKEYGPDRQEYWIRNSNITSVTKYASIWRPNN